MIVTSYERAERDILFSLARPTDILFDVGAYVGWYTYEFARRFPSGFVFAFEPILDIRVELQRNIADLDNVVCVPFGLSDKVGIADFYVSPRETGTASMAPLEEDRFGPTVPTPLEVMTIDRFCKSLVPPSLIKIDVEGAELLVLKGAASTLAAHHPIIQCEMLRKWTKRFDYHPNDIIELMKGFGYNCFRLHGKGLELFETMTDATMERNFFFIHPERGL